MFQSCPSIHQWLFPRAIGPHVGSCHRRVRPVPHSDVMTRCQSGPAPHANNTHSPSPGQANTRAATQPARHEPPSLPSALSSNPPRTHVHTHPAQPNLRDPPLLSLPAAAAAAPLAFLPGPMSSRCPARSPSRRSVLFVMPAASRRCSLSAAVPFFALHTRAPFFAGCGLLARPAAGGLLVFFGAPCAIAGSGACVWGVRVAVGGLDFDLCSSRWGSAAVFNTGMAR